MTVVVTASPFFFLFENVSFLLSMLSLLWEQDALLDAPDFVFCFFTCLPY